MAHGSLTADHLLVAKDSTIKLCSFSKATPIANVNELKADCEGMGLSILNGAIGSSSNVEAEVAVQNPRFFNFKHQDRPTLDAFYL
jgi:hypothetical protein